MPKIKCAVKNGASPSGKPRIYFTCHPDDFDNFFSSICEDLFNAHDCAVYYTADMSEPFEEEYLGTDLGSNNLFVVPVTLKLLTQPNRAMDDDIRYAKEHHIPILPFMMEQGLDQLYSRQDKFGERQYVMQFSFDPTEISYEEKLKKYLGAQLADDKLIRQIKGEFENYIFLSYRKKDRQYANELMQVIHDIPGCRDIPIWYDEFLSPSENFERNINDALSKSCMFILLVTPSMLGFRDDGTPNYVISDEFPNARDRKNKGELDILPVEMVKTSKRLLKKHFKGIKGILKFQRDDIEDFKETLQIKISRSTEKFWHRSKGSDHNYLIGKAYLNGIDFEVNRPRGIELLRSAALNGHVNAMLDLYTIYNSGPGNEQDAKEALYWITRLKDYYVSRLGKEHKNTLMLISMQAHAYRKADDAHKALENFEYLYNVYLRLYGEDNDKTVNMLREVALCHAKMKDYSRALEMHRKLYDLRCKLFGENHAGALCSLADIAETYGMIGDTANMKMIYEKLFELKYKVNGELGLRQALIDSMVTCTALKLHDMAREIGQWFCDVTYRLRGSDLKATSIASALFAATCEKMGDYEQAARSFSQAAEVGEKLNGRCHILTIWHLFRAAEMYELARDYAKALEIYNDVSERYTHTWEIQYKNTKIGSNPHHSMLNAEAIGDKIGGIQKKLGAQD